MCRLTGAALAMWRNHAALAALRGWLHAAQWQHHTRTALMPCIARLQFRVRVLAMVEHFLHTASSPAHGRLLAKNIEPSCSIWPWPI